MHIVIRVPGKEIVVSKELAHNGHKKAATDAYAVLDNAFAVAANQLKAFAAMNEGHAKFPEALLTLGNAQIELKLPQDAKKTLNDLVDQYPNTDAAAAAKSRLAKLK